MTTDLESLRENYDRAALDEASIADNPVTLFGQWLTQAIQLNVPEPYALSLATASLSGVPSVRTVLLRGYGAGDDNDGFVFYTNYASEKGQQLAENPQAQMLFFWHQLEQQVRVSGRVEKLTETESTNYFHKRPRDSQLGAWVSQPQSGKVDSREVMETAYTDLQHTYSEEKVVPKPPEWGGYKLVPNRFEFWQGRPNRMHDRIVFSKSNTANSGWDISRLYP